MDINTKSSDNQNTSCDNTASPSLGRDATNPLSPLLPINKKPNQHTKITESTADHKDVATSASGAPAQNGVAVTATKIKISLLDLTLQTRAATNPHTITEYAERMTEGDQFPPVVVFEDADHCHWLADGFHRVRAAQQCDFVDIECELHKGSRSEALKHALKANVINGLQRTCADKRRCVCLALKEFGDKSDRAIADMCGVSQPFVSQLRPQVKTVITSTPGAGTEAPTAVPVKRIGKDGKRYPVKGVTAPATAAKTDHTANLQNDHAEAIENVAKLMRIDPELVRQAEKLNEASPEKAAEVRAGKKTIYQAMCEINRPDESDNDGIATAMQGDMPGLARLETIWIEYLDALAHATWYEKEAFNYYDVSGYEADMEQKAKRTAESAQ